MGDPGEVYILHNCSFRPNLLKIGMTTTRAQVRAKHLRTTGVPEHFTVLFSLHVADAEHVERRLHVRFDEHRATSDREFFRVAPTTAINALLEEAGLLDVAPSMASHADALRRLLDSYGALIDPTLESVVVAVDDGVNLIASRARAGEETFVRTDLNFIGDEDGPYFSNVDDPDAAVELLLALGPYSLAMTTPVFDPRGAQLIADLHQCADVDSEQLSDILRRYIDLAEEGGLGSIEVAARTDFNLPARNRQIVSVLEHEGRFLISLLPGELTARRIKVASEDSDAVDRGEPVSTAVVTTAQIDELDFEGVIDIAYRDSPNTHAADGPRIQVLGVSGDGIPFEQTFVFLP